MSPEQMSGALLGLFETNCNQTTAYYGPKNNLGQQFEFTYVSKGTDKHIKARLIEFGQSAPVEFETYILAGGELIPAPVMGPYRGHICSLNKTSPEGHPAEDQELVAKFIFPSFQTSPGLFSELTSSIGHILKRENKKDDSSYKVPIRTRLKKLGNTIRAMTLGL